MGNDYSNKNLQKASLANQNYSAANFSGSDLRGADLSGSNLTDADFSNIRTGILPAYVVLIFILATGVSLLSGYIAAKVSLLIRQILLSPDQGARISAIVTLVILGLGVIFTCWKGGYKSITYLIFPMAILGIALAVAANLSGIGTGKNLMYLVLSLVMVVVMVYIGTISRVAAGSLSNILFTIVALSGGMFGKSISGTIGPVILAVICMVISKEALSGKKEFFVLKKTAGFITAKFGTSFRNAILLNTNFSNSTLHNADFTGADLTSANWTDARRINCKQDDLIITDKKKKKDG